MKITGANTVAQPVEAVWAAILDPRVLVATIPGCEQLAATGENAYDMTVTAGVAAIKGTYSGTCAMADLVERQSLTMRLQGAGAPGTIDAVVDVGLEDLGADGTRISYAADATVGGMVGGVGQRMLGSVAKRMAGEFFANLGRAIDAPRGTGPGEAAPVQVAVPVGGAVPGQLPGQVPGQVYGAPTATGASGSSDELLKGMVVGAGLLLVGIAVGAALGGRHRG